ncbi:MAG: ribonuclease HII [Spirochaetia bacterium]|jgi:ribonuclease HII|nr:ribonuclease HII [Spirochaetia bacterium]
MKLVCGIDEAGRGPIAGPVTAGAVILPIDFPYEILNDSKLLSEKKREFAAEIILKKSIAYGIGWVWPPEIDKINIHHASLLAMKRAYGQLKVKADFTMIDGKFTPDIDVKSEAIVKGDLKIREIQAASILAKTARDRWMIRYSWIDGRYGFEKHKGYPTKYHREQCLEYGISYIHRKSFKIL